LRLLFLLRLGLSPNRFVVLTLRLWRRSGEGIVLIIAATKDVAVSTTRGFTNATSGLQAIGGGRDGGLDSIRKGFSRSAGALNGL
jgi:hypothetical protein